MTSSNEPDGFKGDGLTAPVAGTTNYNSPGGEREPSFEPIALPEDDALPPKSERIDVAALKSALDGKWEPYRDEGRDMAADPEYARPYGLTTAEQRDLTLRRVKKLSELPWAKGLYEDAVNRTAQPGQFIVRFQEFVNADPSTQIKAGVQWGLFGSALLNLGNREQVDKWLPDIADLTLPGCFAMTEISHGSDVASLATRATYDPDTEEFIVDTPFRGAMKDFIGNAAKDGQAAVVFATLISKGVDHGVHGFFVPIRDKEGNPLPGVTIEDDGVKAGLNGIDNGRIAFDHVRIPRFNQLDRFGGVQKDGTYSSPIESPGRRFFTMIGTLVQGRVMLTGAGVAASKLGLSIAINYAVQRKQFPHPDKPGRQFTIMDYNLHKHRLLPKLAETIGMAFAEQELIDAYDKDFAGGASSGDNTETLETMVASYKPRATWLALDVLQEAREALGGAGYMETNHIAPLRQDIDIFTTFEGDNNILTQLVAKRLLTDYGKNFENFGVGAIAKLVGGRVSTLAERYTPLTSVKQGVADRGSSKRTASNVRDEDFQVELIGTRVQKMIEELANKLRIVRNDNPGTQLMQRFQGEMIDMAKSKVDLDILEAYNRVLPTIRDTNTKKVVTYLRDIYALTTIDKHMGWYLLNGQLSQGRGRAIVDEINELFEDVRPHLTDIVAAFGYDQRHWRATVLDGTEITRQEEEEAFYKAERERGETPKSEKEMFKAARAAAKKKKGKK